MPFSLSNHPFDVRAIMLLDGSQPGTGWQYDGYSTSGALTLTYSFSTNAPASFRQIYQDAFTELSSYINVTFQQLSDETELFDASSYRPDFGSDASADLGVYPPCIRRTDRV